ncbi:MAG: agmatinase [Candidatus Micrarchaeia archaeon]
MHILNSLPPYNLFGLENSDYETSKIVVLPIPYDSTSSYKAGSREGPKAIIEASRQIELFNEETEHDISNIGIYTTEEIEPNINSPEGMINRIEKEVKPLIDDKKFPLLLGGEHTIAVGSIKALKSSGHDFTVLQFDAHSDSRDEFMGSKYSHACVMARAKEITGSCYGVGIRSINRESFQEKRNEFLFMKDIKRMEIEEVVENICKNTKKQVYISFDFDVLDPSIMPSVGTPEPDGISFEFAKEVIKMVAKKKNIIGMDFNELNPIPGLSAPNYLAAKLIYFTVSYIFNERA